jgi:hypothetical protein
LKSCHRVATAAFSCPILVMPLLVMPILVMPSPVMPSPVMPILGEARVRRKAPVDISPEHQ